MKRFNTYLIPTVLFLSSYLFAQEKPVTNETQIALTTHVKTLSTPEYGGRAADQAGIHLAAKYIIKQFKKNGIKPFPATKQYSQEFNIIRNIKLDMHASFLLNNTKTNEKIFLTQKRKAIYFTKDMTLHNKEIVFVGYGITREGYDDYAGINVKGKVLLMFRYEPEETGQQKYRPTKHAWIKTKYQLAKKKGAVAVLFVNSPNGKITQRDDPFFYQRPQKLLSTELSTLPYIQFKRTLLDLIEKQTGLSFSKIQTQMDQDKKPHSFLLKNLKLNANLSYRQQSFNTKNVVGFLPGTDPVLSKESIVIGAHFDHVGYGYFGSLSGEKGTLHPGADDNASGTAAIIEAAKFLKNSPTPLKRNIIFVLFSAEEMGLLGSRYFASNFAKKMNVVAMINLDMVGNYNDKQSLRINGIHSSKVFKPLIDKVNFFDLKKSYSNYSPHLGATDHLSFFHQGIPSVALFTGFSENYHRPTDTHEFVNFDGLKKITAITGEFALSICNYQGSIQLNTQHQYNRRASVTNIQFNLLSDNVINKVAKGSPEEKAGIKVGDQLIEVDYIKVSLLLEYYSIMRDRATGEKLQLKVKRKITIKENGKNKETNKELEFIIQL